MKSILILGGGYGGLKCANKLLKTFKNQDVKITLVSKHDYHYPTTLLHKVAVGTYNARKARIYFRKVLKAENFTFIKDEIKNIDFDNKKVFGTHACYEYDYLVVSLGFRPNTFGIKGVEEHSFKLSSLNEALLLRKHIEDKFKDFYLEKNRTDLSFAICGSGFTGVELAGELANEVKSLCECSGIEPEIVKIYLIGRSDRILPMFNEKLSLIAKRKLEKLGITVVKGSVVECKKEGVIIKKDDETTELIEANTVVWTAGVKGSEAVENSGIESKNSRIEVNSKLQFEKYPKVYAIGDSAIANERDLQHAPTAQLAYQMGDYVAGCLEKEINKVSIKKPFKFKHRGTVCSIGHTDAVGQAYGVSFSGEIGAFMKNFIENKWIFSVAGLINVFKKGQFRFRSSS